MFKNWEIKTKNLCSEMGGRWFGSVRRSIKVLYAQEYAIKPWMWQKLKKVRYNFENFLMEK